MAKVAALLAAAVLGLAVTGCGGDDGAEPGAPRSATLVLDFQPNAVHAGIYEALRAGLFRERGIRLRVREPGESTDAPKLLASGDVEFAVLDIQDLGIARQAGIDVVGVAPLVDRPLASVIARREIRRPRDLEGRRAGVAGLPSDDAVLDSVVAADGGDPERVRRIDIGFEAVDALESGRVDAATAFWNAEGVELRRRRVPVRTFRVERFGAPPFPELVLVASRRTLAREEAVVRGLVHAVAAGNRRALENGPRALLSSNRGLDAGVMRAQFRAVRPVLARSARFDRSALERWSGWAARHGIVRRRPRIEEAFALELLP